MEASIVIQGAPVVLMDTAGFRNPEDVVEAMGVARSRAAIEDAACIVAVFDRASSLSSEDKMVAEVVQGKSTIAVLNKSDLVSEDEAVQRERAVCAALGLDPSGEGRRVFRISALTGAGAPRLMQDLMTRLEALAAAVPLDAPGEPAGPSVLRDDGENRA